MPSEMPIDSTPISILHVCPRHSFSGLELWVLEMARFQRSHGLDARLIALANSPLEQKAREAGIPVSTIEGIVNRKSLAAGLEKAKFEFAFEILHFHGSQDFKAASPWIGWQKLINRARFKVILQLHIWISHSKRDPWHHLAYLALDEVWGSSGPARESLFKNLPVRDKQIRIVHYGRDVATLEAGFMSKADARKALALPENATVIGTVSRIDRGKGTRELIEGSLTSIEANSLLHLYLIGGPTDDPVEMQFAESLKQRVRLLPQETQSRIHFAGNVKDSFKFLRAFDIFALPTYRECFSLALIEAQLAGLPCLASNAGGSPELVKEDATGWLCEPESVDSLATTLHRALSNRESWKSFGETARERILREFDSQTTLNETVQGYRSLLQK